MLAFVAPLLSGRRGAALNPALFVGLLLAASAALLGLALYAGRLSTRLLAVLAALSAVDAALRLVVVVGLWGFSPIFFLMLAAGFALGPGFGFAMGSLTLLLSALLSGGTGPWLPYQMLGAGLVGGGAGFLGRLTGADTGWFGMTVLAAYSVVAGFAYGLLLDLWEWPFLLASGSGPLSWVPGLPARELAHRFLAFYLTTSLVYDAFRAAGNCVLTLLLGAPVVGMLLRFRRRFLVEWVPAVAGARNMAGYAGSPHPRAADPARGQ
jgi:energy-coupling factor transport system substrate-specific component